MSRPLSSIASGAPFSFIKLYRYLLSSISLERKILAPTYGLSELTARIPCSERLEKVDERPVEQATAVVSNVVTRTRESVTRQRVNTGELRIYRP
jgi:hypothetical protein